MNTETMTTSVRRSPRIAEMNEKRRQQSETDLTKMVDNEKESKIIAQNKRRDCYSYTFMMLDLTLTVIHAVLLYNRFLR
jgi:hypothetical protein